MALNAVICVPVNHFAKTSKRDWFDAHAGFLGHLPFHGLLQPLAKFDHPPRKAEQPVRRRPVAPHHQDLVVADDGGTHGKKRSGGIGPWVRHGNWFFGRRFGRAVG